MKKIVLKKDRWRNKVLWVAIAAIAFQALTDLGYSITPESWEFYIGGILYVLTFLGIITDPNHGEGLSDE